MCKNSRTGIYVCACAIFCSGYRCGTDFILLFRNNIFLQGETLKMKNKNLNKTAAFKMYILPLSGSYSFNIAKLQSV